MSFTNSATVVDTDYAILNDTYTVIFDNTSGNLETVLFEHSYSNAGGTNPNLIGIQDLAGNPMADDPLTATSNPLSAPYSIIGVETLDVNTDGFLDGLRVTFSRNIDDLSIAGAALVRSRRRLGP